MPPINNPIAETPLFIELKVNNTKFEVDSNNVNNQIISLHNKYPNAEIIKLPPGRAQKYFCKFKVAILYPLIEAPHCDAILKPIDHVEIKIYFPAHDTSAIKSLGLRRG